MWAFRALLLLAVAAMAAAQPINPDIRINNVDGVNGQASGAPGSQAAVFLPLGCATVGASTTIQAPAHGMSGFPTDGSSALWLETASGRRWTEVTGFPSGDTITVQDSFNIGVAVNCAMGGEIAGTLGNVTRLCLDLRNGWTVTIENTGVDYTDTGACSCCGTFTSPNDQGLLVIRGDDPENPTRILYQTNASYMEDSNTSALKIENLRFSKDTAAGTAGNVIGGLTSVQLKNVVMDANQGQWNAALGGVGNTSVISSRFVGPFTNTAIGSPAIIGNTWENISASLSALSSGSGTAILLFNIILDGVGGVSGSVNAGWNGLALYNTVTGQTGGGVTVGANFPAMVSGALIGEAASGSGACFTAGTSAANLLGDSGEPHILWQGNSSDECPTARYAGGLSTTQQGAATDVNAGVQVIPGFIDEPGLNFFPGNAALKSVTVFPGSAFPLLTPALPVSTMTAGAAQRPGSGGVSAYGYSGP